RADSNVSSNSPPASTQAPSSSTASSSTASARPAPAPAPDDDSDRPVLRRGRPAASAGSSASADDSVIASVSGARPSIHADEVNGVTRPPEPPRVDNTTAANVD